MEVFLFGIVRLPFVTHDCGEERDVEIAGIFVSFGVTGGSFQSPGTFGVNFACESQVHVVAYSEIVTTVTEVETAVIVIAERWHYNT